MAIVHRNWVVVVVVNILLVAVEVFCGIPCSDNYCAANEVKCLKFNDTDCDLVLRDASLCGCCDTCITYLHEKDKCSPIGRTELGAVGKFSHCGPKLECIDRQCTKRKFKCFGDLNTFVKEREEDGWLHIGLPEPVCEDSGNHFRKQCRPGSMCYCADRDGKRIFGETTDKVPLEEGCACSRAFDELQKAIGSTDLGKWMNDPSDRLGHFLRCKDNGDYDLLQCVGDKCYCLNVTMEVKSEVKFDISGFRNLTCYDPNYHDERYYRTCEKELKWKLDQKKYLESKGHIVIGMDFPTCDLDGTYSPKQCRSNECFCANKDGDKIDRRYSVPRQDADNMECQCAREYLFLRQHSLTKKVMCDDYGNYRPKQCLGDRCYCVDEKTGKQIDKELDPLENKQCGSSDL